MATNITFHNGSIISVDFDDIPSFHHVDLRSPSDVSFRHDEQPFLEYAISADEIRYNRGHRSELLVYDEFAGIDLLREYADPPQRDWLELDKYEIVVKDGIFELKLKKAPDFGEFSPSQELDNYVNTLIQGK